MADEQTPQSDLIDDAIRQAERQLEEKLQALRMSALGEPAPQASAPVEDDVAVLRPTGSAARASEGAADADAADAPAPPTAATPDPTPELPEPAPRSGRWQETGGDDVSFAPVDGGAGSKTSDHLYVPEAELPLDDEPSDLDALPADPDESDSLRQSLSTSVTDLTPVWDDEDEGSVPPAPAMMPTTRRSEDRPEPVHASWTDSGRPRREPAERITSLPSEDEMQFWAHTRTALRNLQQVTDTLGPQVVGEVSTEVARLLHEELSATDQALRNLQADLQRTTSQELPQLADRLQEAVEQAVAAPNNAIRQVRDEIPSQLDRVNRAQQDHLRDELDRTASGIHGAVQHDITQLEQSVASNVTRLTQGTTDAIGRVERDVDVLGETVVRVERGVHAEFDRFESQLRGAIERVEQNLRDELVTPTETLRKIDDELPSRFSRIERAVVDQLQTGQRDMSQVLTSLVDADRAALDRLQSLASTLDEDRARRTEDLEVVVDTVTTGWEGLAGAMTALFEQVEQQSRRMSGIEQRLGQLRDVEGALQQTLDEFQRHMRDLKPSPIVVTVAHDEAEVRNATRSGWTPDSTT